jgi:hypothetical protein
MENVAIEIERDAAGRFVPGQSGNPAGKKPGTRNRVTLLRDYLDAAEEEAVARVVIDKALAGDVAAAKFVVRLIAPRPRGRTIRIELPEGYECNVVAAYNATLRALCEGVITPDEAVVVSRFLDGRRRVLDAWAKEENLTSYDRTIPGDPPVHYVDDEDEFASAAEDATDDVVAAAPAAQPDSVLQISCISPSPEPAPQPDSALQTACIAPSPGTIRGMIRVPVGGFDAALAASVARRLAGRFDPR